jgi:hypothetical protein
MVLTLQRPVVIVKLTSKQKRMRAHSPTSPTFDPEAMLR